MAANDELVNKVVEEVSKVSTEEKQTLSAKVLKAIVDTEPTKIDIIDDKLHFDKKKIQFNHPNYSGLQFNQLTRTEIPADYIDSVVVKTSKGIFSYEGTIGISQNHYFTLFSGDIEKIIYTDNLGNNYEESYE